MARFRFPLQNILNMKEKLEDQAKNEYGQAHAKLLREQELLDMILARHAQAQQELKQMLSEVLSVPEVQRKENAVDILKSYVEQQQLVVKRCEKQLEIAREKLTEAMKERKIFEKLREKALEEFRKEEGIKEQKEVDELMSYKYGTKTTNVNV